MELIDTNSTESQSFQELFHNLRPPDPAARPTQVSGWPPGSWAAHHRLAVLRDIRLPLRASLALWLAGIRTLCRPEDAPAVLMPVHPH